MKPPPYSIALASRFRPFLAFYLRNSNPISVTTQWSEDRIIMLVKFNDMEKLKHKKESPS